MQPARRARQVVVDLIAVTALVAVQLGAVVPVYADDSSPPATDVSAAEEAPLDEAPPAEDEPQADEPPAEEPPAAKSQPAEEPPAEEPPAGEPPSIETDAAGDAPPAGEQPAAEEPASVEASPAEEAPAEEAPAEEAPAAKASAAKTSSVESPATAAAPSPAEEPPADKAPVDRAPADETPAAETPAAGPAPAAKTRAEAPATAGEPPAEESPSEEPLAQTAAAPTATAPTQEDATDAPVADGPVARAPGDLVISDHEGQLKSAGGTLGAYTNGNVTQYAEKDDLNFRFDLDAAAAGSGTLEVRFSGNIAGGSGCTPFFDQAFSLGTHDGSNPAVVTNSGATPTVGTGSLTASGNQWVQVLNVSFGGSGSATVYYHLTLSSVAGDCGGSSQHSRIGTTTGDFANAGSQNIPVPAKDVLELPGITVTKLIDRDGNGTFESTASAGEYCFSLDGGACVPTDGAGQVVFSGIPSPGAPADPHNHTITETQLDFSQGTYVFASGTGTNCVFNADVATATIQADFNNPQNASCTFNNEVVKGNIVVEKQTLPDGSPQQFTFTPSYGAAFQLSDGQTNDSGPLVPGNYSVAETVPAGWVLTSATCDDGSAPGNITLDPGETVTCTFTNTQDGKIVVVKETLPDGDPETFDFSGDLNGTIGDGGMLMDDVAPGQYTVTEDPPPAGWNLTDVDCDDGNSTGDTGTATATFNVEPGETVTCTFTNTKDGKIVVEKQTQPDGDPETFDFSGDLVGTIGDGGMLMDDVAPGQYEVTEDSIPAGWTLASVNCDDLNSVGDAGNAKATFNVEPGETVTCTFNNTNLPTIVVQKQTLPDGDPGTFDFTGAVNATLGDGDSDLAVVAVGQHQVTETVPAGWVLTDITCDDGDSSGDTTTGTATFNVSAGEVVTCVFTNTKNGSITVEKQTAPDGDPQQFDFAGDLAGQIPDDGSISLPVQPGQYSTTETVPAGWALTDITCSDGNSSGDTNTGEATFNVEAGESVTCVFTNTKDGSITVEKQTDPDGSGQQFTFAGDLAGQIPDDGSISLPVQPGQYSTTETVPAGWQLTDITCSDGNSVGDTLSATAMYDVSAGEHVTCVFTNTQEGSITIVKDALPPDGTNFQFDGSFGPFELDDDADANLPDSVTFGGLLPGQYDVTEAVPAGWELIGIVCDDGSPTDLNAASASIALAAGEDVQCTFTNRQFGQIVVEKATAPAGSAQQFTFLPSYGAPFQLSDGQSNSSPLLAAGQYSVSEQVPAGWVLTSATCDDGSAPGAIALDAGETVTCTFTNTQDGRIVVEKQTLPDGSAQTFDFSGALVATLGDGGQASAAVQPGSFDVQETVAAGWVLTDITCDDGDSTGNAGTATATFNVAPGETVTCVFTNTQDGRIVVQKQTDPPGTGQLFSFSGVTNAAIPHNGQILVDIVPGQHVMTESVPSGWQLTSIACDDTDSAGDTATGAATFQVDPGETVTCVFTNTQEGSITIVKDASPADGTNFSFDGAFGPFELDDDADLVLPDAVTFGGLLPGTYPVTEQVPAGWELIGLACDDGSATDLATATATVGLTAGEHVVCTFTNRQFGRIVVAKVTEPPGSAQQFTFTPSYGAPFDLTDGQTADSGPLTPGQHSVAEQVPTGWDLTAATCDDGSDPAAIDVAPGETVTCTFTNTQQLPGIDIQKTPDTQTVAVGGTVTFSITVTNTGNVPLENVAVADPNAPGCDRAIGALGVADSVTYDCTVTISDDLTNVAIATGEGPSGQPVQDDDDAFVNAIPTITVVKSGTATLPEPGGTATFTLVITNTSGASDPVTVTSVVDSIHGDVVAAPGSTCVLPQVVQPGAEYSCSFTGLVTGGPGDSETDVIAVGATDDEGTPATASDDHVVTITDLPSSILVTKSASPTSVPETGGPVTFTVTVANTSQVDSVTVTSVVDDVFGDVSSSCQPALPHVLGPQATLTCTFVRTVSGPAATDHRNVATVTGTDDDGNPVAGNDDAVVDRTPVIDLEVTADFDPTAVVLDFDPAIDTDEQSVLTVTVTNRGPSAASGVTAEVRLPAGVTYTSHSCSIGTSGSEVGASATTCAFDPTTSALTIGDLAVGGVITLRITVGVNVVGSHVAVAEVMTANEPDVDSTPGNGILAEDDQDDAVVAAAQVAATGTIGDTVFRDDDGDGRQDPGEPGIGAVTVALTMVATNAVTTATTNADGKYLFSALPPGDYRVNVLLGTVPAGFTATTVTQFSVALAEGGSFLDADFGFRPPPPQVLPRTGSDSQRIFWTGLGMVTVGVLALGLTRRREQLEVAQHEGSAN